MKAVEEKHVSWRIALIVHVYYAHLWQELIPAIQTIIAWPCDLFVTLPPANMSLTDEIRRLFPNANIRIVSNRGYDIGPFIDMLNQINLDDYKYIVKLHTKRDVTERFKCWVNGRHFYGDVWRKKLLSFCSTASNFNATLLRLESNPQIGMAAEESLIIREDDVFEHIYKGIPNAAKAFIKSCGLEMGKAEFVAGTMFIARASLFKPIQNQISIDDFSATSDKRYNCDLAYNLERVIGYLVGAQGMHIADYKKDSRIQRFIHAYYRTRLIFLRYITGRFLVNM